jgi:hypothetical protein
MGRKASSSLLIAETIIRITVRTLPSYSVTRHAPNIFHHALLANGETTATPPTERSVIFTAMTFNLSSLATLLPVSRSICKAVHVQPLARISHEEFILLLII